MKNFNLAKLLNLSCKSLTPVLRNGLYLHYDEATSDRNMQASIGMPETARNFP